MAKTRKVDGFIEDTARPNWRRPITLNLDALSGGANAGTVPLANAATISVSEAGDAILKRSTFTLTAASVTTVDATTAGAQGNIQLYDFPAGLITILGGTLSLSLTAGAGGIADTAAVVTSVGSASAVNDNATLTTTEANMVASTAATLSGGVNAAVVGVGLTPATLDGHSTACKAYLNFAMPDAGSSADDTIAVTGTVQILWALVGDC